MSSWILRNCVKLDVVSQISISSVFLAKYCVGWDRFDWHTFSVFFSFVYLYFKHIPTVLKSIMFFYNEGLVFQVCCIFFFILNIKWKTNNYAIWQMDQESTVQFIAWIMFFFRNIFVWLHGKLMRCMCPLNSTSNEYFSLTPSFCSYLRISLFECLNM